ncbi:MAG: hypothetical protein IPK74_19590 [Deltaproteobacteria bacterium]|nr:hypothetical protein [Deltaproteobacteria bacterium]
MSAIPVVLLHGALRSSLGMWPTAAYLRCRGLQPRAFDYATRSATLEQHARRLDAFVQEWLGPRPPVLGFLTHSMGALVVRKYLTTATLGDEQRVVMLSPPNRGSQLAARNQGRRAFRLLYGHAADELQPERVARLPALPASAHVLVLAGGRGDARGFNPLVEGDDDGVVAVDEMRLPGVEPTFVGGLHATLQWRRTVLEPAATFLRGG